MGACVSRSRGATEFNHKDFKKALSNIDKKATKIVRLDPSYRHAAAKKKDGALEHH